MRRVAWLLPIAVIGGCTYTGRSPGGDDGGDDTPPPAFYVDCAEARALGEDTSGMYLLDPDGSGAYDAYCDMETDGGGWTLALKIDGNLATFAYDSPIWTGAELYNGFAAHHDDVEALLPSYTRVRADEVMIETSTGRVWVDPGGQDPLAEHVTGVTKLSWPPADLLSWASLVSLTALSPCLTFEGTNLTDGAYGIRVGFTALDEDDGYCDQIETAIGVGLRSGDSCDDGPGGPGPQAPISAGVIDDGCATPVFAYVYVRDNEPY